MFNLQPPNPKSADNSEYLLFMLHIVALLDKLETSQLEIGGIKISAYRSSETWSVYYEETRKTRKKEHILRVIRYTGQPNEILIFDNHPVVSLSTWDTENSVQQWSVEMNVQEAIKALDLGLSIYAESENVSKRLITKDPDFCGRKKVMKQAGGATVSCTNSEIAIRFVLGDAPLNEIKGSFSLVKDDDPVFDTFAKSLRGEY